jgi:spore maturation protein A
MLNKIWPIFIIISVVCAIGMGNLEELNNAIFDSTENAISITITLIGTMSLWSGIMKIASNISLIEKLCKIFNPIINFLFPDLKKSKKIKKEISMNIIANILGLGNAATPLGLKAMESMQKENAHPEYLSNSMMTFILINTASIQLIPTTVLAIRQSLGSNNPTEIIIPAWISSICAAVCGILVVKILIKKVGYK